MTTAKEIIDKCKAGEDITWEEYCIAADRTLSEKFYGDKYPLYLAQTIIQMYIGVGELLDQLKKALFYGKNVEEVAEEHKAKLSEILMLENKPQDEDWNLDLKGQKMMHFVLGAATESVELVQALIKSIYTGEPLDEINMIEEMGDGMWYNAIPFNLSSNPKDLGPTLRKNLLKLNERFGDKFTEDKANNRDLDAERKILEETV